MEEAARCLQCKKPGCVEGCPVGVDIPGFINLINEGDFTGAIRNLWTKNALPAVCGRVCPQEIQCEGHCILGKRASRWPSATWSGSPPTMSASTAPAYCRPRPSPPARRVAVVGSGPSGLTVAGDLIVKGHE